jgi:ABC-type bacteriocin/lantibiotic exporter with double-glycine peptidase domain
VSPHEEMAGIISFTGARSLYPQRGEAYEVILGELLVFAELASGRRLPIATIDVGTTMAGCGETRSGTRLLVVTQQGTSVRQVDVQDAVANEPQRFEKWINILGVSALNGRWASKVVTPESTESLQLVPGEAVVVTTDPVPSSDTSVLGWLKVTKGLATYCGWTHAQVDPLSGAIPMTRGVWLTSGLRCEIERESAPVSGAQWVDGLDQVGKLTIESIRETNQMVDSIAQDRRALAEGLATTAITQGVETIAGAVIGSRAHSGGNVDPESRPLFAAFTTLENSGFIVDQIARDRSQEKVQAGCEPFAAAAAVSGARARQVQLSPGWIKDEGPPLVVELQDGSCASIFWSRGAWRVMSPLSPGVIDRVDEDLIHKLSGRAWEFLPVLANKPWQAKALVRLGLTRSGADVTVLTLLTMGIVVTAFLTPYILGKIAGNVLDTDARGVFVAMSTLLLLLIASTGWQYVRRIVMLRIRVRGTSLASGALWDRIIRLRLTWHNSFDLGERKAQAIAVFDAKNAIPATGILDLLDTVAVVGLLAAIATTNVTFFVSATLFLIIQFFVNLWLIRMGSRLMVLRVSAQAQAQGRLLETLRAVNKLNVSGAQSRAFKRWASMQAVLTRSDLSVRRVAMVQAVVISAWPLFGLVLIVAMQGVTGASFGDFITAQAALAIATTTLATTTFASSDLINAKVILEKATPALVAIPEGGSDALDPGIVNGAVTLTDIVFRYGSSSQPVLDGVSIKINPGEQIAIIGPSGCGKTTLLRLLLGLEDPESGVVTIDGQDLAILDRPAFRRQVGSVLQSASLLPGSIRENVNMGRGLTHSEIWRALESASIATEVQAMDLRLDTPVIDGGGSLSGGQRQRILLARALAGNPRMLILDEGTSALDNLTQKSIVEHLDFLRITRIVVAHRLSTVQGADQIIVVDGGKVVQHGTFDELNNAPGFFEKFAKRQLV